MPGEDTTYLDRPYISVLAVLQSPLPAEASVGARAYEPSAQPDVRGSTKETVISLRIKVLVEAVLLRIATPQALRAFS